MDFKCYQLMRCILYYASSILITNAKIEASKGLILYNNENGIIVLKTHVYADHCMIMKIFWRSKFFIKWTLWEATCKENTSCKWNHYL